MGWKIKKYSLCLSIILVGSNYPVVSETHVQWDR